MLEKKCQHNVQKSKFFSSDGKGIKILLRVYISTGINLRTSNYIIIFFIVVIEIKGCKKSYLPYLDGIDLSFLIDYTF